MRCWGLAPATFDINYFRKASRWRMTFQRDFFEEVGKKMREDVNITSRAFDAHLIYGDYYSRGRQRRSYRGRLSMTFTIYFVVTFIDIREMRTIRPRFSTYYKTHRSRRRHAACSRGWYRWRKGSLQKQSILAMLRYIIGIDDDFKYFAQCCSRDFYAISPI